MTVSPNETDMNSVKGQNEMFIVMYWRSPHTCTADLRVWGGMSSTCRLSVKIQSNVGSRLKNFYLRRLSVNLS